ncbi:MAG: hypothetical protein ACK4QW_08600 [Alphaproteobacteria bacterium]
MAASAGTGSAVAQVAGQTAIDQRVREIVPQRPLEPAPSAIGRSPFGEILLLREREFFTAAVTGGANYTSNAFLSDRDRQNDVFVSLDASLQAATVIAERFEVFAEFGAFALRYAENSELNVNGVRGRVGVSTTVEGFNLGFAYAPSIAWDDDFDRRFVTLHPLTLSINRPLAVADGVLLVPGLSGGYTFADPGDFAAASATASVSAIWLPSADFSLSLTPSVSHRHYDDYFERITGRTRKDWTYGVFLAATYIPFPEALLQLGVSGSINRSTVDPLDHKVFNAGPTARFSMRF